MLRNIINKDNAVLVIFLLFVGKIGFNGNADIAEAIIALGLAGILGFMAHIEKHPSIKEMKEVINKQNQALELMAKEVDGVKSHISGMKLQQNMKSFSSK
jgi:hypothetical protein